MGDTLQKENCWQPINRAHFNSQGQKELLASPRKNMLRKFCSNKLAVLSVLILSLFSLAAIFGPIFSSHSVEETALDYSNVPPLLSLYKIEEGVYLYMHPDYYFLQVSKEGKILKRLIPVVNDTINHYRKFLVERHEVMIDYSFLKKSRTPSPEKTFAVLLDGQEIIPAKTVWNKIFLLGTDSLGRDLFVRTLDGARISLMIAAFATLINSLIGVFYGGIAGYCGGRIDNLMMRVVDTISTIPMTLIVIMLMVSVGSGITTIILAMGIANWCPMARIIRGQILSLKEREFVLAAKAANAGSLWIIWYHLIPNTAPSIIVCMTMMVPSAIFTESFLSFIGLGVSAPSASWGSLVNEGLSGFRSFHYQLLIPSFSICITILSLNFIGRGLQFALSPYEDD